MSYQIQIRAGTLRIDTRREDLPLEALLEFASRENPRRGFLFVSRVLGKHIPCAPSQMREVYRRLAEKLADLPGPVVVIGMAETAIGLGGGVADGLAALRGEDAVLFLHTTRHPLPRKNLLCFDENHSHAPDHILYLPEDDNLALFRQARTLVLVDDEISTGRTLRRLADELIHHLPALRVCCATSIVNWLPTDTQRHWGEGLAAEVRFASLLEGSFSFQPDGGFRPALPPRVTASQPGRPARADAGRLGLRLSTDVVLPGGPVPAGPLVVVGTGEFAFQPFLAAERLAARGRDVLFQSTTRSPILEGEGITRKLIFDDEHDEGVCNYLYNLPRDRALILAYEQAAMARGHGFPAPIAAHWWLD